MVLKNGLVRPMGWAQRPRRPSVDGTDRGHNKNRGLCLTQQRLLALMLA